MSISLRKYEQDLIDSLVAEIKAAGFRVFLAERGTYGFYTNEAGSSIVSFQIDLGTINFSGNYESEQSGTGWRLDTSDFESMLKAMPPQWAVGRETRAVRMITLADHLKRYQSSSKFTEVK